jgi:L-serine dehydratase
MGPQRAARIFARLHPRAERFKVTLYGSLAATGKGHMTDVAIKEVLEPIAPVTIEWRSDVFLPFHPNGMKFEYEPCSDAGEAEKAAPRAWLVYSVGGGALSEGDAAKHPELVGEKTLSEGLVQESPDIYDLTHLTDIQYWCDKHGCAYWEYVKQCEDEGLSDYLLEVWHSMQRSVEAGLNHEGRLPGPLNLQRKAATYYVKAQGYKANLQSRGLVYAYALAVSEENASGGTIVTAPTCGSCGVVPGVLYHLAKGHGFSDEKMVHALATAGLIGNIVKENASISGADVGCQGEVGVACAMASGAACQLFGGSPAQIEYAAEMGLEHHLGMTCDPVCGLVQIPCIERNAFAATRALDCNLYASFSDGRHRVSFDRVVEVMKQTGHDLPSLYKETGEGGLAKDWQKS